jgi:NAD(P)-dependent dehydrogenase (short-subunit alcohol dehydrogenase family)
VGLIARGSDGLEAAKLEVERAGGRAVAVAGDVSNATEVEAAASRIDDELGPIDIWVNNAMASVVSPIREMTPEDYQRVTDVTYLGLVYGSLAALRRMRPRNRGVLVQVGSALAYRGIPLQSAYCAAKHAIEGFCDSLRAELLHDRSRVRVTMVQLPADRRAGALRPPHNLWQPLDDKHDVGAHGRFDGRAVASSWQFVLSRHHTALAGIGATIAGAALVAIVRRTRDRQEAAG